MNRSSRRLKSIRSLQDLTPDPHNANRHTERGTALMETSIRDCGFGDSLTVDRHGVIISGDQRAETVGGLGMTRPIVVRSDGRRPIVHQRTDLALGQDPHARKLAILSNRVGEVNLAWNPEQLAALPEQGVDPSELWFEDEFAKVLGPVEPHAGQTDPDAVPEPRRTSIKSGDLFELGAHRLLVGDSTVAADVEQLMGDVRATLMSTDPPYGVHLDHGWRVRAGVNRSARTRPVTNDDRTDWTAAWQLAPTDVAYVWHGAMKTCEVWRSLEAAGFVPRQQIIWAKPVATLSRSAYHWRHEPCWFAVRKGKTAHWVGDRKQTTLWEAASPIMPWGGGGDDVKTDHPTQKPVALFLAPIQNHTAAGDVVYEPFLGSGTGLIACEQLGRRCFAMEIAPVEAQVAIDRWEAFTGKTVTKAGGRPRRRRRR